MSRKRIIGYIGIFTCCFMLSYSVLIAFHKRKSTIKSTPIPPHYTDVELVEHAPHRCTLMEENFWRCDEDDAVCYVARFGGVSCKFK